MAGGGGVRLQLPRGMTDGRVRMKLKNKHPTNENQLRKLLTEHHTVEGLHQHCRDLEVGGHSGKRKEELVNLLVDYWKIALAKGESHKSLPAVDIRSSVSTVVP